MLSEDSPFLDIVREGLKLALPSAEIMHPLVEPAHGAALLARAQHLGPSAAAAADAAAADAAGRDVAGSPLGGGSFGGQFRLLERHWPPRRRHTSGSDPGTRCVLRSVLVLACIERSSMDDE